MNIIRTSDNKLFRLIRLIPEPTEEEREIYKEIYRVDTILHKNGKHFLADSISDADVVADDTLLN